MDKISYIETAGQDRRLSAEPYDGPDQRMARKSDLANAEKSFNRLAVVWAGITIVGGTLITAGVLNFPLYTKVAAAEAQAKQAIRDDTQDNRLNIMDNRLGNIEKNGARSLELQQRAAKRSLENDLRALTPNSPGRDNLERQLDQIKQDLGER